MVVFGSRGQLGVELVRVLTERGLPVSGFDRPTWTSGTPRSMEQTLAQSRSRDCGELRRLQSSGCCRNEPAPAFIAMGSRSEIGHGLPATGRAVGALFHRLCLRWHRRPSPIPNRTSHIRWAPTGFRNSPANLRTAYLDAADDSDLRRLRTRGLQNRPRKFIELMLRQAGGKRPSAW